MGRQFVLRYLFSQVYQSIVADLKREVINWDELAMLFEIVGNSKHSAKLTIYKARGGKLTLVSDLVSVENFVHSLYPSASMYKLTAPLTLAANMFVLRFVNESRTLETAAHFRMDRDYQIVYYGENGLDVLTIMDGLSKAFYQKKVIPITDSSRFIGMKSFSFSQLSQTENGLYTAIGALSTETREARDCDPSEKIGRVNARIE